MLLSKESSNSPRKKKLPKKKNASTLNWLTNCESLRIFTFECANEMRVVIVITAFQCRCIYWYEKLQISQIVYVEIRLWRSRRILCKCMGRTARTWATVELRIKHKSITIQAFYLKYESRAAEQPRCFHSECVKYISKFLVLQCQQSWWAGTIFPSSITFNIHSAIRIR